MEVIGINWAYVLTVLGILALLIWVVIAMAYALFRNRRNH